MNKPKRISSNPWHLFIKENKMGLSILGNIWKNMSDYEKNEYKEIVKNSENIYNRAMEDYKNGEYIDDELIIYSNGSFSK
jgi:ABC-type transporter MlaC component